MGLQDCVPSVGSRKEVFPCLFQCLEAFCLPWFMASSFHHSDLGFHCFPFLPDSDPSASFKFFFNKKNLFLYLFIWLQWVLVVACQIFSCGLWSLSGSMWNLVFIWRIEPGLPALGTWNLSHWTTREAPASLYKGSCDYTVPTRMSQDHHPTSWSLIIVEKILWPCKLAYSQVLGVRMWTS